MRLGTLAKLPVEALDRPEALMATTRKTVRELGRLGAQVLCQDRTERLLKVKHEENSITTSTNQSQEPIASHSASNLRQANGTPSKRHGEWALFVEHVARNGLQEEDSLTETLLELAAWLWWVEAFQHRDKEALIVEVLDWFVENRHNGRSSRINEGQMDQVKSHIRRIVQCASEISDVRSLEIFARMRQKRELGLYRRVIRVLPLLGGEQEEQQDNGVILFSSCFTISNFDDALLPNDIEDQLLAVAQEKRMRRRGGEYPFLRFARRFLNTLWDNSGQARLGTDSLNAMSGSQKADSQIAYKRHLQDAGLIGDWQGTHRRGTASTLYGLTSRARQAFERRDQSKQLLRVGYAQVVLPTRGTGNQVVASGSPLDVHPGVVEDGQRWLRPDRLLHGSPLTIPRRTDERHDRLHELARVRRRFHPGGGGPLPPTRRTYGRTADVRLRAASDARMADLSSCPSERPRTQRRKRRQSRQPTLTSTAVG